MRIFSFGIDSMEEDYKKVKWAIQHSHLSPFINRSTVLSANSWASAKWGKSIDYRIILSYLGVPIVEN